MAEQREHDNSDWLLLLLLVFGGAALFLYSRGAIGAGAAGAYVGSGAQAVTGGPGASATGTAPAGAATGAAGTNLASQVSCDFSAVFPMQISANGIAFCKSNEGLTLTAIGDANGYEIGYGHFIVPGDGLGPGSTIDQCTAEALFTADMAKAQAIVNGAVKVPLTQNQFDALCDFVYNVGPGNPNHVPPIPGFLTSTLLRDLNDCNYEGAQAQFGAWVFSGVQQSSGLVKRREAEACLFASANCAAANLPAPPTQTASAPLTITQTQTA